MKSCVGVWNCIGPCRANQRLACRASRYLLSYNPTMATSPSKDPPSPSPLSLTSHTTSVDERYARQAMKL